MFLSSTVWFCSLAALYLIGQQLLQNHKGEERSHNRFGGFDDVEERQRAIRNAKRASDMRQNVEEGERKDLEEIDGTKLRYCSQAAYPHDGYILKKLTQKIKGAEAEIAYRNSDRKLEHRENKWSLYHLQRLLVADVETYRQSASNPFPHSGAERALYCYRASYIYHMEIDTTRVQVLSAAPASEHSQAVESGELACLSSTHTTPPSVESLIILLR